MSEENSDNWVLRVVRRFRRRTDVVVFIFVLGVFVAGMGFQTLVLSFRDDVRIIEVEQDLRVCSQQGEQLTKKNSSFQELLSSQNEKLRKCSDDYAKSVRALSDQKSKGEKPRGQPEAEKTAKRLKNIFGGYGYLLFPPSLSKGLTIGYIDGIHISALTKLCKISVRSIFESNFFQINSANNPNAYSLEFYWDESGKGVAYRDSDSIGKPDFLYLANAHSVAKFHPTTSIALLRYGKKAQIHAVKVFEDSVEPFGFDKVLILQKIAGKDTVLREALASEIAHKIERSLEDYLDKKCGQSSE